MKTLHTASAVIVAAGSSSRMGKDKMLFSLCGKSVIQRTVEVFYNHPQIDEVIVVSSEKNEKIFDEEIKKCGISGVRIILGGKTRGESSLKGIREASGEIVLIHDGARPLVSQKIISETIENAFNYGAAAPAVKPKDTIKHISDGFAAQTIPRDETVLIQTPQAFMRDNILAAYDKFGTEETDDCALMEKMGAKIKIVEGSYENLKLTTPEDILIAQQILKNIYNVEETHTYRIGTGFDSHRFALGRKLILGGVEIPCEKGLVGHSDADALVHSIIDALFGAAALGDIGTHFPDTDEKYKDADSMKLLKKAAELVYENGYKICNIDSTIIVQSPKMAPYIESMREKIADVLEIPKTQISIKAKTNEKMGFVGRGEGIETRAVALLH